MEENKYVIILDEENCYKIWNLTKKETPKSENFKALQTMYIMEAI